MKVSNEVLDKLEDLALVSQHIDQICCALENGDRQLPNFIPVCNDYMLTERLTYLTEYINKLRGGANG